MAQTRQEPKQAEPKLKQRPYRLTSARFDNLVRSKRGSLDAYLSEVESRVSIGDTQTKIHIHHLRFDGNNQVRVKDFCERMAQELIHYCIPRSDYNSALNSDGDDVGRKMVQLYQKSIRLFTDLEKSGEGGEVLLYLLTETYLKIPQILCKMPLKTSSNVHYHGADAIHGMYESKQGKLALYWGESKLYQDVSKAISACLMSLAPFVIGEGGSGAPQKRDIELLSDYLDLDDDNLEQAILRYLDPDDAQFNKLEYRGIALVGFDSVEYENKASEAELRKAIKASAAAWKESVDTQLANKVLEKTTIELFCLPLPSVDQFRAAFREELGIK